MMTTRSANDVADELFELIVDNEFTLDPRNTHGNESEWKFAYPNGAYSILEVIISGQTIEIWRGEYAKGDKQIGAKQSTTLRGSITPEAMRLIRPLG